MPSFAQRQVLLGNKRAKKIRLKRLSCTEQVASWLASDDTPGARLFAYGVCAASGVVFTAAVLKGLF